MAATNSTPNSETVGASAASSTDQQPILDNTATEYKSSADDQGNATVLFRMASGPHAGETLSAHTEKIVIGAGRQCEISLPEALGTELAPGLPSQAAMVEKLAEGWVLRPAKGVKSFLNQRFVSGPVFIRSGDILRLSIDGPDLQILLQHSGQRSLESIAHDYGHSRSPGPDKVEESTNESEQLDEPVPPIAELPDTEPSRGRKGRLLDRVSRHPRTTAAAIAASLLIVIATAAWGFYSFQQSRSDQNQKVAEPRAPKSSSLTPVIESPPTIPSQLTAQSQ